ncbi:hypothetical protein ACP4OV_031981 [Aristida adscensionis]
MMHTKVWMVVAVVASLGGAPLLAGGDDDGSCSGVWTVAVDKACYEASTGAAMYDLCMSILKSSPANSEQSAYALRAASAATDSSKYTLASGEEMSRNSTITGEVRNAWGGCNPLYDAAIDALAGAEEQLRQCAFGGLGQRYMDALSPIEDCTTRMLSVGGQTTPLYSMIIGDRDRAVLAFRLAKPLIP